MSTFPFPCSEVFNVKLNVNVKQAENVSILSTKKDNTHLEKNNYMHKNSPTSTVSELRFIDLTCQFPSIGFLK